MFRTREHHVIIWICFFVAKVLTDTCPEGEPVTEFDVQKEVDPSIYDDLTIEEITKIHSFMTSRKEFPIIDGLTAAMDAIINCSYIYHIERLSPAKADTLKYLDHSGPKPKRFAWLVMYRGDANPPVIEEYKIGPLPDIEGYEKMSVTGRTDSIDYIKRNYLAPPDFTSFTIVAARELAKVDYILERETGYKYSDCGKKCLRWVPGVPGMMKAGSRSMWMYLVRVHEGLYLHPVGLQFRVDTKGNLDLNNWEVNFVWFRGASYKTFDEMVDTYVKSGSGHPKVYEDNEDLFSSLNHRGVPLPEKIQRGPRSFMPDGRRYSVSGHHLEWQGWTLDFNMRSIIGMQVHDLRFKGERIAYELSLSEVGIIYSGASPSPAHTAYIDSTYYLGAESFQLFPGLDCPDHATFFDFAHFINFNAVVFPNSVCVFEHRKSVPLRRHSEFNGKGGIKYAQGMPGNVLILRSIIIVENYDYVLDYILYQNGAIEVSTSLSGYILGSYYTGTPEDDRFGFEVSPSLLGQIHNHLIHFKVDLDILGTSNRFETLDAHIENIPDPADSNERINAHVFRRNLRTTEKNATYKFNFDTPKYLVFHNNEERNHVGNPRGYRLLPVGMTKQLLPEGWAIEEGFSWARYQVAVTKQKDHEARASSIFNVADLVKPHVNFQDFIDDDENIVDEDLVAWVSLGSLHIPHSEDIPIVQTPALSLSFYLLPYNFFNEDVSLASRDNIRVTTRDDGGADVAYAGGSMDVDCEPRLMRDVDVASGVKSAARVTSSSAAASHVNMTLFMTLFGAALSVLNGAK